MAEKVISVIVPVYRIKEEYLRHCLDSLMKQNSDRYQVILIDDGSPDNSGRICDEYAEKSDIFRVIHQENKGVSEARNAGIDAADTEWITFADPDDWLDENAMVRELEALGRAGDADIILFDYSREYVNESQRESLPVPEGYLQEPLAGACRKAPFFKLFTEGKLNPYSVNALWNKVYRRDFILSHGIRFVPEARKGQDRLFNAEAFNSTDRFYYLKEHLYHYRCNEESVSNKYNRNIVDLTLVEIRELQKVMDRHDLPWQKFLNARICTRLYSCMRLYYFHPSNERTVRERKKDFRDLVSGEPFRSAIATVDMGLLSKTEKLFVISLKYKMYDLCRALVLMKASYFGEKLSK